MLWADAWVIQAGGDGVRLLYLAVSIAHQIGARTVEDAHRSVVDGGAVLAGVEALASWLSAN